MRRYEYNISSVIIDSIGSPQIDDVDMYDAPAPDQPSTPEPEQNAAGRPIRKKRLTWKLLQQLPVPPAVIPDPVEEPEVRDISPPPGPSFVWEGIKTAMNAFGLYREYPSMPTHNPDDVLTLDDLSDAPRPPEASGTSPPRPPRPVLSSDETSGESAYAPFANSSTWGLMDWMWNGSASKSIAEVTKLVDFLKSPDFRKEDIEGLDIK